MFTIWALTQLDGHTLIDLSLRKIKACDSVTVATTPDYLSINVLHMLHLLWCGCTRLVVLTTENFNADHKAYRDYSQQVLVQVISFPASEPLKGAIVSNHFGNSR